MPYVSDEIIRQYRESAGFAEEHEQNRWGSRASMLNRMQLAIDEMPFENASSWLDVGCGSGAFQQLVAQTCPAIASVGIDISPAMLEHARAKQLKHVEFLETDFLSFTGRRFDLITCLGVLQKTNMTVDNFFAHAEKLMSPAGYLFVSTKNMDWRAFTEGELSPCDAHQWFTENELFVAIENTHGLELQRFGGFLAAENEKVPSSQSHDIYLVIRRHDER